MTEQRPVGEMLSSVPVFAGAVVELFSNSYDRSGVAIELDVIMHPGGVVMIPVEDDRVLMVRQPREAVGERLLELPAGKFDEPGEDPLACARRELGEEVARAAGQWRDLGGFYTAPGISTEFIHCFLATELAPVDVAPIPDEEIEVVAWPLDDLDALIDEVRDAKSLVGLLRLARLLPLAG